MDSLLTMLNHLIAKALEGASDQGAFRLRSLTLDEQGGHLVGRIEHPAAQGELVMRFRIEAVPGSGSGQKQVIRLTCVTLPDTLGPGLEPFRRLIETARLSLELDFSEDAEGDPS